MVRDKRLDTLLELNGIEYRLNDNYWVKFEIYQVAAVTSQVPHGIRYSLTLHDRYNKRIMGFDNAHAVKTNRKKYSGNLNRRLRRLRRLRRFSPTFLGVDSSWTTHCVNCGSEVGLISVISVICVICGSDVL